MTHIEKIYEADPEALASIFEVAFMRLGELGRDGGVAVCGRLKGHEGWDVEEGIAQLEPLYAEQSS
jgi:hypothetical protein